MKKLLTLLALLAAVVAMPAAAMQVELQPAKVKLSAYKLRKGRQIPAFTMPERQGGQATFGGGTHSGAGKHTLLIYSDTGCGYCYMAIKALSRVYDQFDDNLNIISVWGDKVREYWLDVHKEHKEPICWSDLWDEKGEFREYAHIKIFPTIILLDPQDKVMRRMKGFSVKILSEWLQPFKEQTSE